MHSLQSLSRLLNKSTIVQLQTVLRKKPKNWPWAWYIDVNGQAKINNFTSLIKRDAQHEKKRPHDRSRNKTTDIWHSKKLCFWKNHQEVFNQLKLMNWIKLELLRKEVTWGNCENRYYWNDRQPEKVIGKKIILENFFSWIKMIKVDLIQQSCRLYIRKIRPDLIYVQSIPSIPRRLTGSKVIYKISIHHEQQPWSRSSYSTLDVPDCPYLFIFIQWYTDPLYLYALICIYFLIPHKVSRLIINDSFIICYKSFTLSMITMFFYPISLPFTPWGLDLSGVPGILGSSRSLTLPWHYSSKKQRQRRPPNTEIKIKTIRNNEVALQHLILYCL